MDIEAFRRGHTNAGERCELAGVGPVPVAMVEHFVGRSRLELVVRNGVDIASVVSLGRTIPRALRTALQVRDGTCVVPGCDVRSPLEVDHVIPFAQGGPTALHNLASLCPHHHDLKTYRGWTLSGVPGNWRFLPPDASPGPAETAGPSDAGVPAREPARPERSRPSAPATLFGHDPAA